MNTARCVCAISLSLVFLTRCHSQSDSVITMKDTVAGFLPLAKDSIEHLPQQLGYRKYEPSKKPWVAVGLSAAVPGMGQIYDQSYWKLPIIWGLGGYWVYEWVQQNRKYQDFRDKYSASVTPLTPGGNSQYLLLRDFYRNERDSFAWYLGALYFLNLVDAYVGANLYDFDVSPDLSAEGRIVPRVKATVRLRF